MQTKDSRNLTARPADPTPELGPCMRVLPHRWRRAVDALFVTEGDRTKALRLAGYSGKPESMNVMASRIFGDARVRAAVREECMKRIDISEPELYATTMSIIRDSEEKAADRLRAVAMVWDRANPVMTRHKIEVEHHLTADERDVLHYRALQRLGAPDEAFVARFGPHGVARVAALIGAEEAKQRQIEGETIDAEYEEVPLPVVAVTDAFDEELL